MHVYNLVYSYTNLCAVFDVNSEFDFEKNYFHTPSHLKLILV